MQETEIAFLLGAYMELVNIEVVGKQKELILGYWYIYNLFNI